MTNKPQVEPQLPGWRPVNGLTQHFRIRFTARRPPCMCEDCEIERRRLRWVEEHCQIMGVMGGVRACRAFAHGASLLVDGTVVMRLDEHGRVLGPIC